MNHLFINLMNTYSWGTCWGSQGSCPGRQLSCRRLGLCGPSVCGSSRSYPCTSYTAYGAVSWWMSSHRIARSEPQFYIHIKYLIKTQAIISQNIKTYRSCFLKRNWKKYIRDDILWLVNQLISRNDGNRLQNQ